MNIFNRSAFVLNMLVGSLVISGCAVPTKNIGESNSSNWQPIFSTLQKKATEDQMATHMVKQLIRTRGASGDLIKIAATEPTTMFGDALNMKLTRAGYELISEFQAADSIDRLSYQVFQRAEKNKMIRLVKVSVGSLMLDQHFTVSETTALPNGIMSVSYRADDGTLAMQPADQQVATLVPVPIEEPAPAIVIKKSEEQNQYSDTDIKPFASRTRPNAFLPRNVRDLGASNYEEIFMDTQLKKQTVLVFANDSLRLGKANKQAIRTLLDGYNHDKEIISVLGCSHGKTSIANGNEFLATGRANRVKEELILWEVPSASIYDEGCWDSKSAPNLPPRGVLMSIRTLNS